MVATIDGSALAREVGVETARSVAALRARRDTVPGLAVTLVGNDPASEVYVARKLAETIRVGIRSIEHRLAAATDQATLLALIAMLNPAVHGILVQLPLPPQIDAARVLDAIDPAKDVDGFHPVNVGRLSIGTGGLVPCTPLGCLKLLDTVIHDYRGLAAVVIGKSNIVVAAAGSPRLVRGDWIKPGAVVIDVGITRVTSDDGRQRLVGDVAFDEIDHARAATPEPGGVGPMTIACLLANTALAATRAAA